MWAQLTAVRSAAAELALLWSDCLARLRHRFAGGVLTDSQVVQEIRRLFRTAGCDPTRYRPSSEALARRALRGDELPRIHPLVDLNNLLSLELLVPCCVVDASRVVPPLVLRSGRAGERMASLRGDFDLAGKPLLADCNGPFGTPITDSERVTIGPDVTEAWMVAYLPRSVVSVAMAENTLAMLIERAPIAKLELP
jgi:DNA/RNA-binding domain of Phe-tRNA-synthetase-like protein